jgi:redox-sensitive bicupin YhaK (pirin superfamily)
VALRGPTTVEINERFEYGVVPIDRPIKVGDAIVEPGSLALVPPGYEVLRLETRKGPGRAMLLGGLPLGESVKMWWNFVARTEDEITEAWSDWQNHNDARFARVPSGLPRMEAPRPPWLTPET